MIYNKYWYIINIGIFKINFFSASGSQFISHFQHQNSTIFHHLTQVSTFQVGQKCIITETNIARYPESGKKLYKVLFRLKT